MKCRRCSKSTSWNSKTDRSHTLCDEHRKRHAEANRKCYQNGGNRRRDRKYDVEYKRRKVKVAKKLLFSVYGDKCKCCNESEEKFLTLDHVKGDGKKDRTKIQYKIYEDAARANDPSRFRILCMNCNWAIGKYGECPHKTYKKNKEI